MAKKEFKVEKPIEPLKPDRKDKYLIDLEIYRADLEEYEQYRLIRLIKNSSDILCLKKYKIIKRK